MHSDLKPANLLLDHLGHAVITCFGLARSQRMLSDDDRCFEGTAAFMALEQVVFSYGQIGPWTDIYAHGAVVYTFLTGRPLYMGNRPSEVFSQLISNQTYLPPSKLRPEITAALDQICLDCLNRNPNRRPQSGQVVVERLQAILNNG